MTAEKKMSLTKKDEATLQTFANAFGEFWRKNFKIEPK